MFTEMRGPFVLAFPGEFLRVAFLNQLLWLGDRSVLIGSGEVTWFTPGPGEASPWEPHDTPIETGDIGRGRGGI